MKKLIVLSLVLLVIFGTRLFGKDANDANSQTATGENAQQKSEVGKFKVGIGEIKYKAQRNENDKDRQAYGKQNTRRRYAGIY